MCAFIHSWIMYENVTIGNLVELLCLGSSHGHTPGHAYHPVLGSRMPAHPKPLNTITPTDLRKITTLLIGNAMPSPIVYS